MLPKVRDAMARYRRDPAGLLTADGRLDQSNPITSMAMGATNPMGVTGAAKVPGFAAMVAEKLGAAIEERAPQLSALARRGIEAWHGSPYKFDQFSLDKIGTGEGAQAYGHGLYFAENPRVAKEYKLAGPEADRQLSVANARMSEIARELDKLSIPGAHRKYRDPRGEVLAKEYDDLVERRNIGSLYRVNLDVTPDELLDWDKPLSQQSERIRKALPNLRTEMEGQPVGTTIRRAFNHPHFGGDLVGMDAASPDALAAALSDKGVPGLRYLDGGSRGSGDGTRNYVIFDPARITILERLAALGLGGQMVQDMLAKAKRAAQPAGPATLPAVTVTPSPADRKRAMNTPYGYQNYAQRAGSIAPADATAHEAAETPAFETRENDEGSEEGMGGMDPLRLAVLRLLMQREGGR